MSSDDLSERPSLEGLAFTAALRKVPLFPLPDVVLFPNALLPLHIFEPRYRKLTRDALAGSRLIVMGRALGPEPTGGGKTPVARTAGVGEIILAQELPDGRFNLVLRGRSRVEIEQEHPSGEPYRLIACHEIPDDPIASPREIAEAEASLRALAQGLADALPSGGELLKQVVAGQETPAALADVLASTLVVDVGERQALLETTDVGRRLERVTAEVVQMTARVSPSRPAN